MSITVETQHPIEEKESQIIFWQTLAKFLISVTVLSLKSIISHPLGLQILKMALIEPYVSIIVYFFDWQSEIVPHHWSRSPPTNLENY